MHGGVARFARSRPRCVGATSRLDAARLWVHNCMAASLASLARAFAVWLRHRVWVLPAFGELWALTDTFAMDMIWIFVRNLLWRILSSDKRICNEFGIHMLKKATVKNLIKHFDERTASILT